MRIEVEFAALRETKWHEYLVRFALGGLATVLAGVIAKLSGPAIGGLFLAFPAIFFASATLIEKHEQERKERLGLQGRRRGIEAAALDAFGAALGSVALAIFAALVALGVRRWGLFDLAFALIGWCCVAVLLWSIRRRLRCRA